MKLSFAPSIIIVVLGTEFLSIMTYKVVDSGVLCPCRAKKRKAKDSLESREEIIEGHVNTLETSEEHPRERSMNINGSFNNPGDQIKEYSE